ncbi:hypothetical protein BpHYR1_007407, partial [Brachionus plicatilis]
LVHLFELGPVQLALFLAQGLLLLQLLDTCLQFVFSVIFVVKSLAQLVVLVLYLSYLSLQRQLLSYFLLIGLLGFQQLVLQHIHTLLCLHHPGLGVNAERSELFVLGVQFLNALGHLLLVAVAIGHLVVQLLHTALEQFSLSLRFASQLTQVFDLVGQVDVLGLQQLLLLGHLSATLSQIVYFHIELFDLAIEAGLELEHSCFL